MSVVTDTDLPIPVHANRTVAMLQLPEQLLPRYNRSLQFDILPTLNRKNAITSLVWKLPLNGLMSISHEWVKGCFCWHCHTSGSQIYHPTAHE